MAQQPEYIDHLHTIDHPRFTEITANVIINSLILRKHSLQSCLYQCKKTASKIQSILEEEQPDVVVASMIRAGQYLSIIKIPIRIFDMDDCLSLRYKLMLDRNEIYHVLGSLGSSLFGKWSWLLNNAFIGRLFLKNEISLIEKEEEETIQQADATVLVNPIEAEYLSKKLKTRKIVHIPNRVNANFFSPNHKEVLEEYPSLVFHGILSRHHNQTAISQFLERVFPIILKESPRCQFYVIGNDKNAPQELLSRKSANVHFTGYVNDVRPWLSKGMVYISWMLSGSGMKTKVLEAMAMGIPLVTTAFGIQGIPAKDGIHCLIRDDPQSFASAVLALLSDSKKRDFIAHNSRSFVMENYDEHKIVAKWHQLICSLDNHAS